MENKRYTIEIRVIEINSYGTKIKQRFGNEFEQTIKFASTDFQWLIALAKEGLREIEKHVQSDIADITPIDIA